MPEGRMVDQVWTPFPVCWVGDVPGCAVAVCPEVEQPQTIFDPVLRSQAQYLRVSCRIWDYLYALMCPNISLNEDASVHCPSAGK